MARRLFRHRLGGQRHCRGCDVDARFARAGSRSMVEFCRQHNLKHDVCGKVIVATREAELPLLEKLYQRGLANELPVTRLTRDQVREIEPPTAEELTLLRRLDPANFYLRPGRY